MEALANWIRQRPENENTIYLCHQDLRGQYPAGLDLMKELGTERYTILVTSLHDDPEVVDAAKRTGIRLLPNSLLAHLNMRRRT